MNHSAVVCTDVDDPARAGEALADQVRRELGDAPPDALILFVSPKYALEPFLEKVEAGCHPKLMVGCSSAGEFTHHAAGTGQACAVAVRSDEMRFAAGLGRGIQQDRKAAAESLLGGFRGVGRRDGLHRSALVLTDALAGHAEELIETLTFRTGGTYQFFGGGAGDDAAFRRTLVFCGREVASDAAVGLEILSTKPVGIGVRHGWTPASAPLRVTEADGPRLISLNATPAAEVFADHANATGQSLDVHDPIPFFLHNILGIDTGHGHKLRVPLAIHPDGSVSCAAEVPAGSTVQIMSTTTAEARQAAARATADALTRLNGHAPQVAMFFDCVATRLRMGKEFGLELQALREKLEPAAFAGCNTYGQVARAEGQFSGFHNCTAVVCVLPA